MGFKKEATAKGKKFLLRRGCAALLSVSLGLTAVGVPMTAPGVCGGYRQ